MRFPFISEQEVKKALTISELIPFLKKAFQDKATPKVQMPPKPYLFFPREQGDLRVMPCYWEEINLACVKLVNAHPLNPEKFDLPAVMAVIMLYDPVNGLPLCMIEANALTAIRTAAVAALAAEALSLPQISTVGLIGAGTQAYYQLKGLLSVRPISRVKVYSRDAIPLQKLSRACRSLAVTLSPCRTVKEACQEAELLVTLTPSRRPLVKKEWVEPGTHINAIGADAPGKQEVEIDLLKSAKVVVDDWEQAAHGGEINIAVRAGDLSKEEIAGEMSDLVLGRIKRSSRQEITLFDSTGLALQDLAAAHLVYRKMMGKR